MRDEDNQGMSRIFVSSNCITK